MSKIGHSNFTYVKCKSTFKKKKFMLNVPINENNKQMKIYISYPNLPYSLMQGFLAIVYFSFNFPKLNVTINE